MNDYTFIELQPSDPPAYEGAKRTAMKNRYSKDLSPQADPIGKSGQIESKAPLGFVGRGGGLSPPPRGWAPPRGPFNETPNPREACEARPSRGEQPRAI